MPEEQRLFRAIGPVTLDQAEEAFRRNDPDELRLIVVGVSLYSEDLASAEEFCLRCTQHPHHSVRGNAILGLAHLARRFRTISRPQSVDVVRCGLSDENEYVRGHANDAADDLEHYAKLNVRLSKKCEE